MDSQTLGTHGHLDLWFIVGPAASVITCFDTARVVESNVGLVERLVMVVVNERDPGPVEIGATRTIRVLLAPRRKL